jgi:hypothetical protein
VQPLGAELAHAGTHVWPSARATLPRRTMSAKPFPMAPAVGSGPRGATGWSVPYTSCPTPTTVAIALTASGP